MPFFMRYNGFTTKIWRNYYEKNYKSVIDPWLCSSYGNFRNRLDGLRLGSGDNGTLYVQQ